MRYSFFCPQQTADAPHHSGSNPHFLAWPKTTEGSSLPCICPYLAPSLHLLPLLPLWLFFVSQWCHFGCFSICHPISLESPSKQLLTSDPLVHSYLREITLSHPRAACPHLVPLSHIFLFYCLHSRFFFLKLLYICIFSLDLIKLDLAANGRVPK